MFSLRAVFAALLLACPFARGATHEIIMEGYEFVPPRITINVGDTVIWTAHEIDHTVTAEDGSFDSLLFNDSVPLGESFSHRFTRAGTYGYFCAAHGGAGTGMSGVVIVRASTVNRPPSTPMNLLPANNATNQSIAPRLSSGPFQDADADDFHSASQWVVRGPGGGIVLDTGETTQDLVSLQLAGLPDGVTFMWQVRYRDGQGAWSEYSAATQFTTLRQAAAEGSGLLAHYANSPDLSGVLWPATNAVIDFDWGKKRPHRRVTADAFSARWRGYVVPRNSETVQFHVEARGGVRLQVGGNVVVNDPSCGFLRSRRASAVLEAESPVPITLEYFASGEDAGISLKWSGPNLPLETIPTSRMYPPGVLPGYE